MHLSDREFRVLKTIAETDADTGEFISISRLETHTRGFSSEELRAVVDSLERNELVLRDESGAISISEDGIAAMKAV